MSMRQQNLSTFTHANRVELIRGGSAFFELLKSLIDQATETIYFQFYIFDNDQTGREIADALKRAAQRAVSVHLLLDRYASFNLSSEFIQDLKDAGVHFRWFQAFVKGRKFYVGRRLHHKVVVIDRTKSLVSGLNISDRYNDTAESAAWLDWALFTEGSASLRLEQVCKRRIKDYSPTPSLNGTNAAESRCAIKVCVNDWVGRKSEITKSYLKLFNEATERIVVMSPYFMPGRKFRKSLRAAVKRGVRVQIILAGVSDILISKYAERYLYDWLLRLNIEIYEYQKNVLHGKMVVVDGRCLTVGSYNINNLSAYASIELNLEVKDEILAQATEERLRAIMTNDCKKITSMAHQKRSNSFKQLLQASAYLFLRFLLLFFSYNTERQSAPKP